MSSPFEGWTDEQVKHYAITGERPAGINPETNRPITTKEVIKDMFQGKDDTDYSQNMSSGQLFLAGMGSLPARLGRGISELATMATLPNDPDTRKRILNNMESTRAENSRIDSNLFKNPEAIGGRLVSEGVTAAAAPARLPAQVGIQSAMGFLEPPASGTTGLVNELTNRGRVSLERGGTTAAVGYPMMGFGRAFGAARGQYTPEGHTAMNLNKSAQRLGINPTIRDLDPSSEIAGFEGQLFGRAKEVENQLQAFNRAGSELKAVPSATGASTTDRLLEGEKLRQGITDATKNLRISGSKLWSDLDDYIAKNQIQPVIPQKSFEKAEYILQNYTPKNRQGFAFEKNPVIDAVAYYDEEAAKKLIAMGRAPKQAVNFGAPFRDFHEVEAAVGKAFGKAQRDMSAPNPSDATKQAFRELRDLYSSMRLDVDNWMSSVAAKSGNQDLTQMATKANDFWRDAVVPGVSGKLPTKARQGTWRQSPKGYSEPKDFYSDLASAKTQVDELLPYMSQEQQDLMKVFHGMPDLQRALVSGKPHPPATGGAVLTNVSGMMLGSPLQLMKGVLGHTPVVKDLVRSNAGKRLYFSENTLNDSPLGRIAWGMAQKPRGEVQDWERSILDLE